jgi:hypothetical protein
MSNSESACSACTEATDVCLSSRDRNFRKSKPYLRHTASLRRIAGVSIPRVPPASRVASR